MLRSAALRYLQAVKLALNSVNKVRSSFDNLQRLQFHISRGLSIIKDKILAGSWFTPVNYSFHNNNLIKQTPEGRSTWSDQRSIYSSDSDEDFSPQSDPRNFSYRSTGRDLLKRALSDWIVRNLERRIYPEYQRYPNLQTGGTMTRTLMNPLNASKLALISRIILLGIQIIATNLYGFAKHDNDGFKFTPEAGYGTGVDKVVNATIGGFSNWDGQYFLHLAVHGYTRENTLAFFPLFPMTLWILSEGLHVFLGFLMSLSSIVLIVGWILNTWCFMQTAKVLYQIAEYVDSEVAPLSVVLFCFNPASIFFSGLYTESLFALLTAKVILALYEGNIVTAMTCASLSSICRSNGLLNFGFIVFFLMDHSFKTTRGDSLAKVVDVFRQCSVLVLFLIPFFQFQAYGVWKFCNPKALNEGNYVKPPAYCNFETLPYSYVQQKYWNVGFLKYFELKQIPNFLLALPVLYILVTEALKRFTPLVVQSLVIRSPKSVFKTYVAFHGIFLAFFCFLNVHAQVSTRLILSAFPYFYIYLAESCRDETTRYRNHLIHWPVQSICVNFWCLFYFIIGAILFPLGYPWT